VRTLAFATDTVKMSWLIIEGSQSEPKLGSAKLERIKLPADVAEGTGLCSLIQTLSLLIDAQSPKPIAILQAVKSKFNNTSSARIKVEAALQIAAAQKSIPLHLVSPTTTTNYKKKLEKANKSLEGIFNGGEVFSPREMGDVICVGVIKLPHVEI
jgi:Holliday junction resolvasome RuvABC endonuclease subunit